MLRYTETKYRKFKEILKYLKIGDFLEKILNKIGKRTDIKYGFKLNSKSL